MVNDNKIRGAHLYTASEPTDMAEAILYVTEGRDTQATRVATNYVIELCYAGADFRVATIMGIAFLEGYEWALINNKVLKALLPNAGDN